MQHGEVVGLLDVGIKCFLVQPTQLDFAFQKFIIGFPFVGMLVVLDRVILAQVDVTAGAVRGLDFHNVRLSSWG